VEGTISYTEGDLFGGYRRNPSLQLTLNRGHFAGTAQYQIYFLRYGDVSLTGHQLSVRSTYSYTPLARTTAVIEWNTLTFRGVAQLVTSYQFGALSTIGLVLGGTSGATALNPIANAWYDKPDFRVTASFALGLTPF
jgi:hypothetical protein